MSSRRLLLILSGAAIAFVGAVCGIGGGLFAVPLLHYGFGLPLRRAVATSLCLVAANALASTAAELLHEDSAFLWEVVGPLIGGALVGAQLGFFASKRLPERALKGLFAAVMLAVGLRLVLSGDIPAEPTGFDGGYGLVRAGTVALVGVLAGTLSPLLGLGGGLIIVPGLLLSSRRSGASGRARRPWAGPASPRSGRFSCTRASAAWSSESRPGSWPGRSWGRASESRWFIWTGWPRQDAASWPSSCS